jgi:hypothetical protein
MISSYVSKIQVGCGLGKNTYPRKVFPQGLFILALPDYFER